MTKGELTSEILISLGFDAKDTWVSRRWILSTAESIATTYMAQRLDSSKLESDYSLIQSVKCFPMEQVDYISCGYVELRNCKTIFKSKNKIPKTVNGSRGIALFGVNTIDGNVTLIETTRRKYALRKDFKYKRKGNAYYFIEDGYLYVLDFEVELLDLLMVVLDNDEAEEVSECSDCKETKDSSKCKSLWDEKFICPEKLLFNVIQATVQSLSPKVSIPRDENPNMDSNLKTKTVE